MNIKVLAGVAGLFAVVASLGGIAWQIGKDAPSPIAVEAATMTQSDVWSLALKDLDGKSHTLASLRGKPVVMNFWAGWCGPCREELPAFSASNKGWGGKVNFVGVALDKAEDVKAFLKDVPVNYQVLLGEQSAMEAMRGLGNRHGTLPFTVIFDAQGRAVLTTPGKMDRPQLDEYLKPLVPR
ncbi:TlpA family protein disulfide reductase [Burkholderiaceae bacterium DAT-1]|nr:TlpA family protein disulfide reductase [Burkholderiaceae bacterium DAT-1]